MPVCYTAVERFGPSCGERWRSYVEWSGLTHLREVASIDSMLCPSIVGELTDEDWEHNVHEHFLTSLFLDLDYLLAKAAGDDRAEVLSLVRDPTEAEVDSFDDTRFEFLRFDLVETPMGISALVNCGGFDRSFSPADLSACGLIADLARARAVQRSLLEEYPDEPHADCELWAIWRMVGLRDATDR